MRAYELWYPEDRNKYKTTEQRKAEAALEEAKKEGIVPKLSTAEEITAQTPEGNEIVLNLEQIKKHWLDFYNTHDLKEFSRELENMEISLTDEQIQTIKEKAKDKESSFNELILLPSVELQTKHLAKIKKETEKPIPGLADEHQYSNQGTYLSDTVKPNFPQNIKTLNRPQNKPYLLFFQNSPEVPDQTRDQTPSQLRQALKQRKETGLTLSEYLIFQRNYTQTHLKEEKPHPDTKYWTWLLDSENSSARVLSAGWYPVGRRVRACSFTSGGHFGALGCRSSAILELNP